MVKARIWEEMEVSGRKRLGFGGGLVLVDRGDDHDDAFLGEAFAKHRFWPSRGFHREEVLVERWGRARFWPSRGFHREEVLVER
ncbi:hypothetical protein ZIOFF_044829 [Zingiber officinale]|uniref:Uncharacterized protein n=1 Tax=Zingiber officinale TaxID=94328 RepID=A0A8J5G2U7_ZINOF|nr:hypothetical protein ZIOFF_044829 [Zingiber officinale]